MYTATISSFRRDEMQICLHVGTINTRSEVCT